MDTVQDCVAKSVSIDQEDVAGEFSQLPESLITVVDPTIAAEIFLEHRAASAKASVESTVAFSKGMAAFKDDREKLREFLEQLGKAKVLSSEEVAAGLDESKSKSFASKLNKISAYSKVFLDERVISLLNPGYSVLYELALLFEELEKKAEEGSNPFEILLDTMQTRDGPISRGWLKQERAKLKPPRVDAPSIAPEPDAAVVDEPPVSDHQEKVSAGPEVESAVVGTPQKAEASSVQDDREPDVILGEGRTPIAAVIASVNSEIVSRFTKAVAGDRTPVCVKVSEQIAEQAVLIVHGKIGVLLSIAPIVERYGFGTCEGVYLNIQPDGPNVIDQMALAVYLRGGLQLSSDVGDWLSGEYPLQRAAILLDGVNGRRVHLFADSHTFEWESIVGEENWQIEP